MMFGGVDYYKEHPSTLQAPARTVTPEKMVGKNQGHASVPMSPVQPINVGRMRRYSKEKGAWEGWEDLLIQTKNDRKSAGDHVCFGNELTIRLRRGGTIRIYADMIPEERRLAITEQMENSRKYRQYKFSGGVFPEPRLHVLLVSRKEEIVDDKNSTLLPGYHYHGVVLKGQPLESEPQVARLANDLAEIYRLPDRKWNTGVDMIVYRDGKDRIGWHQDDTQGESIVLCVVVDSPDGARTIKIRPLKKFVLQDGDEQIELKIPHGYGYQMDGAMQAEYEHCVPAEADYSSRRLVLIFRQGDETLVSDDSGEAVADVVPQGSSLLSPPPPQPTVIFGPMNSVLEEGNCYSRRELYTLRAHRSDQRGINGNKKDGCDSVVVSNYDGDTIDRIKYSSTSRQGAGAVYRSFELGKQIRVFRSSRLRSKFAPPMKDNKSHQYRYDGLFTVQLVTCNGEVASSPPKARDKNTLFAFHLERSPSLNESEVRTRSQRRQLLGELPKNDLTTQELKTAVERTRLKSGLPFFNQFADASGEHTRLDRLVQELEAL